MWQPFDYYELRARLIPAVILLLPVFVVTAGAAGTDILAPSSAVLSGVFLLAVVYVVGQVVGVLGRRMQDSLFARWGGPPAVLFMRRGNRKLGMTQRCMLEQATEKVLGRRLPTSEQERTDPQSADNRIDSVFNDVRAYLHGNNVPGPWRAHLAEYGMARNVLGSAWLGATLGLVSALVGIAVWLHLGGARTLYSSIGAAAWAILLICARYTFLLVITKECGERYAESAWMSFLQAAWPQLRDKK
jgi:hypothetical protein